jgi:NADPH:quinone reductase-like Zn-dependent oxidoreductase
MKAAKHTIYGGPEVVTVTDIPKPQPQKNEIIIRVIASTVNRTDDGLRSASYFISRFFTGLFKPKQQVLGSEFSGIVEQVGEGVSKWKSGDHVFGFNDTRMGAHAEFMVLHDDDAIALKPENLSFQQAASLSEGGHYALADIYAAKVKSGDEVLVYGATGAIGTAAVQLLKYMGVKVTAVVDSNRVELAHSLGADVVIDYEKTDYSELPHRFDLVFDSVGKSSFSVARKVLKPSGIYVSTELGKRGDNVWRGLISRFQSGQRVLFPIPLTRLEDIQLLGKLAADGKYTPVIDRVYRLDDIVEAHRYVGSGQKTGNVIIEIGSV